MKILVIGGTGPTGPFIVNGLVDRGHEVTILHSGRHELATLPPESRVPHLHADPFDETSFRDAIARRNFDAVFAMYGRLRSIAPVLVGRTARLFSIGGVAVYAGYSDPEGDDAARGIPLPAREDAPLVGAGASDKLRKIRQSEERVFELHPDATHFRYPYIYGPHQVLPREWSLVRRALDRRPHLLLADGGLTLATAAYSGNAAHAVLRAFDRFEKSAGECYNVGDDRQFDLCTVAEIVADELDHEWQILSLPHAVARPAYPLLQGPSASHRCVDTSKLRDQLGYRDLVDPEVALRKTIRWQVEHLAGKSERVERLLQDPFDYEAEDALVAAHHDFVARCNAVPFSNEPGYSYAYYGSRPNPAGRRGSYRE